MLEAIPQLSKTRSDQLAALICKLVAILANGFSRQEITRDTENSFSKEWKTFDRFDTSIDNRSSLFDVCQNVTKM